MKFKGFSLIELMVVLSIMAVLMTLSGGLFEKSIKQQEKHVELEKMKQFFKQLSYKAYYSGIAFDIRLEKNNIIIKNKIEKKTIIFKSLTFVAQNYTVSTVGVITPEQYSIISGDRIKNIPIKQIFDEL